MLPSKRGQVTKRFALTDLDDRRRVGLAELRVFSAVSVPENTGNLIYYATARYFDKRIKLFSSIYLQVGD